MNLLEKTENEIWKAYRNFKRLNREFTAWFKRFWEEHICKEYNNDL